MAIPCMGIILSAHTTVRSAMVYASTPIGKIYFENFAKKNHLICNGLCLDPHGLYLLGVEV